MAFTEVDIYTSVLTPHLATAVFTIFVSVSIIWISFIDSNEIFKSLQASQTKII